MMLKAFGVILGFEKVDVNFWLIASTFAISCEITTPRGVKTLIL